MMIRGESAIVNDIKRFESSRLVTINDECKLNFLELPIFLLLNRTTPALFSSISVPGSLPMLQAWTIGGRMSL